jgi:hypothetical protein
VTAADNHRGSLSRLLPILGWLPQYDRAFLRGDVAAGIAVTALIVPKNLGYAGIAGVPLQNGLYAAAAGAILYALFGTPQQISTCGGKDRALRTHPHHRSRSLLSHARLCHRRIPGTNRGQLGPDREGRLAWVTRNR